MGRGPDRYRFTMACHYMLRNIAAGDHQSAEQCARLAYREANTLGLLTPKFKDYSHVPPLPTEESHADDAED